MTCLPLQKLFVVVLYIFINMRPHCPTLRSTCKVCLTLKCILVFLTEIFSERIYMLPYKLERGQLTFGKSPSLLFVDAIVSQFTHLFSHLYLKSTHRDTTLMRGFSTLVKKLSGRFPVTCHWPREAPELPFALHTILLSVPPHPKLYFLLYPTKVYCVMYTKPYHGGLYHTKPYLRCLGSGAR